MLSFLCLAFFALSSFLSFFCLARMTSCTTKHTRALLLPPPSMALPPSPGFTCEPLSPFSNHSTRHLPRTPPRPNRWEARAKSSRPSLLHRLPRAFSLSQAPSPGRTTPCVARLLPRPGATSLSRHAGRRARLSHRRPLYVRRVVIGHQPPVSPRTPALARASPSSDLSAPRFCRLHLSALWCI